MRVCNRVGMCSSLHVSQRRCLTYVRRSGLFCLPVCLPRTYRMCGARGVRVCVGDAYNSVHQVVGGAVRRVEYDAFLNS